MQWEAQKQVMLRKRSRAKASKQALMADSSSLQSPADKYRKATPSFFGSPKLFTNFTPKCFFETDAHIMSPTSILDSKPFSNFKSTFWSETSSPRIPGTKQKRCWDKLDSKGVGLGLVDALVDDESCEITSKPKTRMVLFGSQLKIQIPSLQFSLLSSSEAEFGTKTRKSQLGFSSSSISPPPERKSDLGSSYSANNNSNSPGGFRGCLSASEMELSEDYTRVISHGPNPKTTHIFDNCIIESSCFDVGFSDSPKENGFLRDHNINYPSENFLSFCFYCKKNLGQGKDIYMYRGERAFCSCECRCEGMLLDEEMDKLEAEDVDGT